MLEKVEFTLEGDNMLDLCQYAVSLGEKLGADELEAMWKKKVSTIIKAEMGEINEASMTESEGLRIRLIKNKALSSVFTYHTDQSSVRKAIEKALHAAEASRKDELWDSLPYPKEYPEVDVWDRNMEEMCSETLMEPVMELIQLTPDNIEVYLAVNEIILHQWAFANSNGIEHTDRGTQEALVFWAARNLKDGITPLFYEGSFLREYNPDPQHLVEELTHNINLFKNPETAFSGRSQVIFSPQALQELVRYTLLTALSGERAARGKSLLVGREGEQIASPQLTLHDNGIIREGISSREMDDEGVPCQDTPLIVKGVLRGFIWNDYWAKHMGVSSTGNAHCYERKGEMSIRQSTMTITPGKYKREELFDIEDGYYVLNVESVHGPDPRSGDFSVVCTPVLKIRKGEISGGMTKMTLMDSFFSLLNKFEAIGSEIKICECSILPHVRFTDMHIVST